MSSVFFELCCFELIRKHSGGGGLAVLAKNDLEPVWVSEGDDQTELLVIQLNIEGFPVRVINAYGPQECDSIERKSLFWSRLQAEITESINADIGIIVQMDGNLHAGSTIVKGDPNIINTNGKFFEDFLAKNPSISVLNGTDKCEGIITRERIKGNKKEQAILDFVLVCDRILPYFEKMIIDEDRVYPLTSYVNKKAKMTDHFTEIIHFDINFRKQKPIREEYFNFKNEESQQLFRKLLDEENNLTKCFLDENDLESQTENWYNELNKLFQRCFRKIRKTNKMKDTDLSLLLKKRSDLKQRIKKNPNDSDLERELEVIESNVTTLVSKDNRDKLFENFQKLDQTQGESFSHGIWTIKKKAFPKVTPSVPAAKLDVNGRMVTDPAGIKKLYLDTFTHRLRHRPSTEDTFELHRLQEKLCKLRLLNTSDIKTNDWTENDILKVLSSLKNGKCRDPLGLINEIFKPPIAGSDLIKSITLMMNKIKNQIQVPKLFTFKNISTIYKNKGSKSDLENNRGIFTCTVPNTILQKLIYNDTYDIIDSNLSDSNVGARKKKNIRNHSFMINGIIMDAVKTNKPVDLAILDYKQCFDSMNVGITLNALHDAGIRNNHLNLIKECDSSSQIAIKTPVGLTKRVELKEIVEQGEVMSPLKCTATVDSISTSHVDNLDEHLYKYKDSVKIPPLGMVDDQIGVSKCGIDSLLSTSHLNAQTNVKRLQFGAKKCHKMHIGKSNLICPVNTINTWDLVPKHENVTSVFDLIDKEGNNYQMTCLSSDLYLGDVLQSNAKNDLNIAERTNKGNGAVQQIMQLLEELCLGKYYFEAACLLRNSLLLSSLLSNSESWYDLSENDIQQLVSIDEQLLRKIFSAPRSTPKELLYLESGSIPIKFILKSRRLNFLWYMLKEKDDSMLKQFLRAQCENPVKGDWVTTVLDDLQELDIKQNFDEISEIPKVTFKNIVNSKVKQKALNFLRNEQQTHSKSKNLHYSDLKLQDYLMSGLSIKEKSFIFLARSRMLNVKCNLKVGRTDLLCSICGLEDEEQEPLLSCTAL